MLSYVKWGILMLTFSPIFMTILLIHIPFCFSVPLPSPQTSTCFPRSSLSQRKLGKELHYLMCLSTCYIFTYNNNCQSTDIFWYFGDFCHYWGSRFSRDGLPKAVGKPSSPRVFAIWKKKSIIPIHGNSFENDWRTQVKYQSCGTILQCYLEGKVWISHRKKEISILHLIPRRLSPTTAFSRKTQI
jgi:hypothetical protein